MTSVALCPAPNYRSLTLAGAPNAGGKLYTYISGTTTNQATYTSSTAGSLNANPVIFDANGFANVWLDTTLTYTLLETDSAGVTIRTQDVISNAAGATGAAGTFACSAAGGTVDAITATYSPVLTLADKTMCAFVSAGKNTLTNPTFAPDGLTAHTITKAGGTALIAGDIGAALSVHILEYNLANTRWELLNPIGNMPLAGGTTGQVLTAVTGGLPTWSAAASTLTLIGSATASGSASLTFTSGITSAYSEILFVIDQLIPATGAGDMYLKLSTNGGSTYAANLITTGSQITGGANNLSGTNSATNSRLNGYSNTVGTSAPLSGEVRIFNPASAAVKTGNMFISWYDPSVAGTVTVLQTVTMTDTSAINAAQFISSAGNIASGSVYMYGVKNT